MLLKRFEETVSKYKMFAEGDSVVAGISGGSDSVCMLHLLCRLKDKMHIKINAVHINHLMRETAERDEIFVKNLCNEWDVSFYSLQCDVTKLAKEQKISTELCGRNVRYGFFREIYEKTGSSAILTAHNKNDNAETVLLHLIRGSGSGGLSAISPVREHICRPLLEFTKSEIEEYLTENNISWVEDETNATNLYTRNIVRHEIIPAIKKINPSVEDALLKSAAFLKEDNDFISFLADMSGALSGKSINLKKFLPLPIPVAKRVIMKALKNAELEVSANTINAVYELKDKQSGKKFIFPCGGEAIREYDRIIFSAHKSAERFSASVGAGEKIFIEKAGINVSLLNEKPSPPYLAISGRCTHLDIRSFEPGDKFVPSGMSGHKKVSDFFADKKISVSERYKIPIFLFENEIAAVGNMRVSNKFLPLDSEDALYLKISDV